jgi:hypothetical protein
MSTTHLMSYAAQSHLMCSIALSVMLALAVGMNASQAAEVAAHPAVGAAQRSTMKPEAAKPAGKTSSATAAARYAPMQISATWVLSVTVDESNAGREFDMAAKMLRAAIRSNGGSVRAGSMQEEGVMTRAGDFRLSSTIVPEGLLATVWHNEQVKRSSEGVVVNDQLMTLRYTDKRGSLESLVVTTDAAAKVVKHARGNEPPRVEPMPVPIADVAVLPWMFTGRPLPQSGVKLAITDGKSVKNAVFDVTREMLRITSERVETLKLVRRRVEADDAAITLWLRAEDGVPMRILLGLNARYGVAIDQQRETLPPVLRWKPLS